MAGHRNINELFDKLSPERQESINKRVEEILKPIEEEKEKEQID